MNISDDDMELRIQEVFDILRKITHELEDMGMKVYVKNHDDEIEVSIRHDGAPH